MKSLSLTCLVMGLACLLAVSTATEELGLDMELSLNEQMEPVNLCNYTAWKIGKCTKYCGGGTQEATRSLVKGPKSVCKNTTKTLKCNQQACQVWEKKISHLTASSTDAYTDLLKFTETAARQLVNSVGFYYTMKRTLKWQDALTFCEKKNMRLCLRSEYCPHGKGKAPKHGLQAGEAWAPVSDQTNDWVYIGNQMKKVCNLHTEMLGKHPDWGVTDVKKTFKGKVACCKLKMDKMATTGPSWNDAVSYCASRQKRLCTKAEYCPDGDGKAPQGGVLKMAEWAAIYDGKNEWVAVGMSFPSKLMCKTHKQIVHKNPAWGKTQKPAPTRGVAMCCPDNFITLSGKISWTEAAAMCKTKQKRLCWKQEYCPSGPKRSPRGGVRPGEAWSPVGDSTNSWVATGRARPQQLCETYAKYNLGKKFPASQKWKGYIQCCDGPPPNGKKKGPGKKPKGNGLAVKAVRNDGKGSSADKSDEAKAKAAARKEKDMKEKTQKKHQAEIVTKSAKARKIEEATKAQRKQWSASRREEDVKGRKERSAKEKKRRQERQAKGDDKDVEKAKKNANEQKLKFEHNKRLAQKAYLDKMAKAINYAKHKTNAALMRAQKIIDAAHAKTVSENPKLIWTRSRKAALYPKNQLSYNSILQNGAQSLSQGTPQEEKQPCKFGECR